MDRRCLVLGCLPLQFDIVFWRLSAVSVAWYNHKQPWLAGVRVHCDRDSLAFGVNPGFGGPSFEVRGFYVRTAADKYTYTSASAAVVEQGWAWNALHCL
jgi:hypothetical protein